MIEAKVADAAARAPKAAEEAPREAEGGEPATPVPAPISDEVESYQPPESSSVPARLLVDSDATEQDVELSIDAKIAASRRQLSPSDCLFCTQRSNSIEDNLRHMHKSHSFFIPDTEFLQDLPGLLTYLGEKLAVGNTCLYCPNGGKEFGSLEAVRAHMRDRAHCKIAYETENDRLEVSDFYDFTSSYPDAELRKKARKQKAKGKTPRYVRPKNESIEEVDEEDEDEDDASEDEEWDEVDSLDGEDADEVVDMEQSGGSETSDDSDSEDDSDLDEVSAKWCVCTVAIQLITTC